MKWTVYAPTSVTLWFAGEAGMRRPQRQVHGTTRGDRSKPSDQALSPAGASTVHQPFSAVAALPLMVNVFDQDGTRKRILPAFSRVTETTTGVSA